jgi:uncharacterized RDD family membrane protein YckC
MIDALVLLPMAFVSLGLLLGSGPAWLRGAWFVVSSFIGVAYIVIMHAAYGQTLGKMATGVKVLDKSGGKLSGRQAFIRELVPMVLILGEVIVGLPGALKGIDLAHPKAAEPTVGFQWLSSAASSGWFLAELLTMLTNDKRRAVHDFIAGSLVVRLKPEPGPFERVS